jgi:hypothetical protein
VPVKIKDGEYVVFTDILGSVGTQRPPPGNVCHSGKAGDGFARIIDLGNEKELATVSKFMLEVHDPANCSKVMYDPTVEFGCGSLTSDVDDPDGKLLACGYMESGLHVFDIRDPVNPREIAYYKPAAQRTRSRPGSIFHKLWGHRDHTADAVMHPLFRNGAQEIWFASADGWFHIVRFSKRLKMLNRQLFQY